MDQDDYYQNTATYMAFTSATAGLIYLAFTKLPAVINYGINLMLYKPGEGKLYTEFNPFTKRKQIYIKNPERDIRLNFIKTPSLDMSVYIFEENVYWTANRLINKDEFQLRYNNNSVIKLREHALGIIDDVYHTRNIKKGYLYGYISSMTEDLIYVFRIDEGLVNFHKIFEDYEFLLDEYDTM